MILLGRSHQGRPEAAGTLTMISHGVEISIAGGGADQRDARQYEAFWLFYFLLFFFIMYSLIKVQETAWSASYGENKTYKQSNHLLHPLMGKIRPLKPRAYPPTI